MGWHFRDKRAENVRKEDSLKRLMREMRRRKPKWLYYTETKRSLGLTQFQCKSSVSISVPTFIFLLETWKCEGLRELQLRVICTWEMHGVAEPDKIENNSLIVYHSFCVCFRCKFPKDLDCKEADSECFQIIFCMAYYGRILTVRYESTMKTEMVQAIGASKNTDFRWCLNELWSVGCRDFQKLHCCFFLHWSDKEGKVLISGIKRVLQSLLCLRDKMMDQERKRM